jgi:hypothetical protein
MDNRRSAHSGRVKSRGEFITLAGPGLFPNFNVDSKIDGV